MAFLRWSEKNSRLRLIRPAKEQSPAEWHEPADPVSSAPPGNTARTTPLWHSLNDTRPDTTSKDKNASRGLQR
ncbi:hypothetical protein ACMZZG_20015, partial [Pseudocitrobacter faecalis]|uniref:hypothetical protein n=1 Tax=Pseudocitrobacter faecalis TaxID=1398493 RepID=UPI0039EE46A1